MIISRNIASRGADNVQSAGVVPAGTKREPLKELDKDAFLELLTVQLRYQDPTSPVKDQDFIAQLAQFSSLEQVQNLTESMNRFTDSFMRVNAVSQAAGLLGKEVEVADPETGERVTAKVTRVTFVDGEPRLHLGGKVYSMWDVKAVTGTGKSGE